MGLEAEYFINTYIPKDNLIYDAKCIKELPHFACQGNFIEKLLIINDKDVML